MGILFKDGKDQKHSLNIFELIGRLRPSHGEEHQIVPFLPSWVPPLNWRFDIQQAYPPFIPSRPY